MAWFRRSESAQPNGPPPLGQADIADISKTALGFIPPVFQHYREANEAKLLVARSKMLRSWPDLLKQTSYVFEAALITLDDRVSAVRQFAKEGRAAPYFDSPGTLDAEFGRPVIDAARANAQRLDEAVDFALAYVLKAGIPVRARLRNGKGVARGNALLMRHEERLPRS